MNITSQRQYDLAKRDLSKAEARISEMESVFNTEIAVLQTAIDVKIAARDQATTFLRRERSELLDAINEWESQQQEDSARPLKVAGE